MLVFAILNWYTCHIVVVESAADYRSEKWRGKKRTTVNAVQYKGMCREYVNYCVRWSLIKIFIRKLVAMRAREYIYMQERKRERPYFSIRKTK